VKDAPAAAWDILIPSIVHRDAALRRLLAELDRQWRPGAGVRLFRDNLEVNYARKCQALAGSSQADYISFLDDDDMVAPDYIARVTAALAGRPDYVGYPVCFTVDGVPQMPVEHSLRYDGWENRADILTRDISQINPIRRDLALLGNWDHDDHGADRHWASAVRDTGLCRAEVWIGEPMYFYRFSSGDSFRSPRTPLPAGELPAPLPSYPWLTVLAAP